MRQKRIFQPCNYYHIYNRSVDGQKVFFTAKDYVFFFGRILFCKIKYKVKIVAYCLLPNHFHFLIEVDKPDARVSAFIATLCNSQAKYFNHRRERTSHVWQDRFKCKPVLYDDYLSTVIKNIELNPIKHGVVQKIEDWTYTSYHGNPWE